MWAQREAHPPAMETGARQEATGSRLAGQMSIILITALALIWLISLEPEPPHDRAANDERCGLDYHACDALSAAGLEADLVTVERVHFDLTSCAEFSRNAPATCMAFLGVSHWGSQCPQRAVTRRLRVQASYRHFAVICQPVFRRVLRHSCREQIK